MATLNKYAILRRAFCTQSEMVKIPLAVFGLEGQYASALYSAATRLKELDKVEQDLLVLQNTLKTNKTLRENLLSPIINKQVLGAALKQAAEQAKMATATGNLLYLMAENGRMKKFDSVVNSFKAVMAAHRGDVVCEVTTAKSLDNDQNSKLQSVLQTFLKPKQSLKVTYTVDPNIIGGMIVSIGDKYIDMSIASKVKLYKDVITSSV